MATGQATHTILLADDDRSLRELVASILRSAGYLVETVGDGQEVLERLGAGGVSLVLLDLGLPKMPGLEVLRLLRALEVESFVPVVVFSGRSDVESLAEALRCGADDFLPKPFDERELLARIAARLRTREQLLALRDGIRTAPKAPEPPKESSDSEGPLLGPLATQDRLAELWRAAERAQQPLGLLLVRSVREDSVAAHSLATILRRAVRGPDAVGRASERSVVALLPATRLAGVLAFANRVLAELQRAGTRASITAAVFPSRELRELGSALSIMEAAATHNASEQASSVYVLAHLGYVYEPPGPEGGGSE